MNDMFDAKESSIPPVWRGKDFDKYFGFTIPEQNSLARLREMIKKRNRGMFVRKKKSRVARMFDAIRRVGRMTGW